MYLFIYLLQIVVDTICTSVYRTVYYETLCNNNKHIQCIFRKVINGCFIIAFLSFLSYILVFHRKKKKVGFGQHGVK